MLWPFSTFCVVDAIRNGIDILVGTPGRIKDHLQNNKLDLSKLKHVVLDEVDQMLDMGFAEQVEEILASSYKKGKFTVLYLALSQITCAVCTVILNVALICEENEDFPLSMLLCRCWYQSTDSAVFSHMSPLGLWCGQEIHEAKV